jgi:methylmalonyl-CoA/ethylmalonyl-CoA epimerase
MKTMKRPIREKIVLKQVLQVSVVVEDLQKSMERYWDLFGIGPWEVFTFQPPDLTHPAIRGKSKPYTMKLALAQIGSMAFELIQPLTGPSIYQEFLDRKGEGFHHVAVAPAYDYESALEAFEKRGIKILMSGTWAGTTYAYMDAEKALGAILEIYQMRPPGIVRPAPEGIFPQADAKIEKPEKVKEIVQIGVVVEDIQKEMKRYWDILGLGPWRIHTYGPQTGMTNMTVHGRPQPYSMKLAIAYVGNTMWELIEPLEGPSVYKEFLREKGKGLHHLQCAVGDYHQAVEALEKKGIGSMMTGTNPQATFNYLNTEKELGIILEILKKGPSGVRGIPEGYYPR